MPSSLRRCPCVCFASVNMVTNVITPSLQMEQVLYLKFTQHEQILRELVATSPAPLVWTSQHDPYWGAGPDGKGRNELGKLLVKVRDKLKEEGGL